MVRGKKISKILKIRKLKLLNLIKMQVLLTMNKSYKRKRFWERNIYKSRMKFSAFFTLLPELRERNPNEGSNEKFFNYLRMTPEDFDSLLDLVAPYLRKSSLSRQSISAGERLALTLRFLASGDLMASVAFSYRVGNTTATNIIRETTQILWDILSKEVFPKYTNETWRSTAEKFYQTADFPNCLGALDGKHVLIQAFPNTGSLNFNYKGTHSIILMAMCDAEYRFTMIDVGAAGRNSDGGVFKNCVFGKHFLKDVADLNFPDKGTLPNSSKIAPYVLVADEAFPLLPNLMRPYPGRNSANRMEHSKAIFNYRLSRARRIIENAFGILSARWRIFRRPIHASRRTVLNIVKASVCLHNWLINRKSSPYIPPLFSDTLNKDGSVKQGAWREISQNDTGTRNLKRTGTNAPTKTGIEVRNIFKDYFSKEGEISWQNNYIYNTF